MQVQYQLTLDDVVAFGRHHARQSDAAKQRMRLARIWALGFGLFTLVAWLQLGIEVPVIFGVLYTLYLLFGYPIYYRWAVERNSRKLYAEGQNKGVVGNHIIAIDAEGVTEISDVGEARTNWSGIEKIEQNDDYLFIYASTVQAHVIPKRAFLSESEAAEFFRLATTYHSNYSRLTDGADNSLSN